MHNCPCVVVCLKTQNKVKSIARSLAACIEIIANLFLQIVLYCCGASEAIKNSNMGHGYAE